MRHEVRIIHKRGRGKDKTKRKMSENSLKNLSPAQPGDPPRNKDGNNGRKRLYTEKYEMTGESVILEPVRIIINMQIRSKLASIMKAMLSQQLLPDKMKKAIEAEIEKDFIPKGCTWAEANSIRMHLESVLEGNVGAAAEVREAVEGRSTMRVEFNKTNDRLEMLLDAFKDARERPPAAPNPESGS